MHPDKRTNYVVSWLCNQPTNQQHPLQESNLHDADYASPLAAIARNRHKNQASFSGTN